MPEYDVNDMSLRDMAQAYNRYAARKVVKLKDLTQGRRRLRQLFEEVGAVHKGEGVYELATRKAPASSALRAEWALAQGPAVNAGPLWSWMRAREALRLRRAEGGPPPWTEDPILHRYGFCNWNREHDRVTRWLRERWYGPHANHENLWFAAIMARMINWPPTLEEIGFPHVWDARRCYEAMSARRARGEKLYTSAYLLKGQPGMEKHWTTVYHVLVPAWKSQRNLVPRPSDNLRSLWKRLKELPYVGGFLAYEIVTDLRHTRYLWQADDIHSWAFAGPGTKRGLNRLHGRPVHADLGDRQALEEMRGLLAASREALPDFPRLEMRDIAHSLGETDKYLRILNGEGQVRSRYDHKKWKAQNARS
jgi:hypothetical protein